MALGIYIHIPFCAKKCPYCDFYSVPYIDDVAERYTSALLTAISACKGQNLAADTVYFGGGTPNLLGSARIEKIITAINSAFNLSGNAEITMEANPETFCTQDISAFSRAGVNRLSLGLQSANRNELSSLDRTHTPRQVLTCIEKSRVAGISNISLDLMLGIEGQTKESLLSSIDFCKNAGAIHISAYLLKIEPNTPFYKKQALLNLPDEDESAELYEFACAELEKRGYKQYEISNFAKNGLISHHNTKYWLCEEYLGLGAAAHGFYKGERYYYERSIEDFIKNPLKTVSDGAGGSAEEALMLALRLSKGIDIEGFEKRYCLSFSPECHKTVEKFVKAGLMQKTQNRISITPKGFLVSNSIIGELLSKI
ncbi:MAG: radical SAM family heme chaperone HemW [Oscillospiraceae bacterium]|nr:radical SAM family heme chaperone HemW [Oscillospiraceae bacterium]